jgi:triosephosphate isomerase (TIM)
MIAPKKYIVQSNWKMYKTHSEAIEWIETLGKASVGIAASIELIVCVPFIHLRAVSSAAQGFDKISIGTQNVHWKEAGAFTGETSAPMIADAGGRYCVVGHSERRNYFGESDELVNRKTRILLQHGIGPIVCIGESSQQREKGLTLDQVEQQVITCFAGLSPAEMQQTVVLYEPIWSIGTGNNATPEQAQEAHHFIREMLARVFSKETAETTRIIYGGSVKINNVTELIQGDDIDGVGAGSGSLNVNEFLKIVESCSQSNRVRQRS